MTLATPTGATAPAPPAGQPAASVERPDAPALQGPVLAAISLPDSIGPERAIRQPFASHVATEPTTQDADAKPFAQERVSGAEPSIAIPVPSPVAINLALSEATESAPDPLASVAVVEPAEVLDPRGDMIDGMSTEANETADAGVEPSSAPDTAIQFDGRRVARWIVDAILRGAEATDADPVYMMALADKESSFIPDVRASSSSAQGLFQFVSGTWLEMMRTFGAKHGYEAEAGAIEMVKGELSVPDEKMRRHILGLRNYAYLSAVMAGEMKKRDTARIEDKLGRKISRSEYYLSHFLGVNNARRFMTLVDEKPKQSAPRLFPAAARANKALFFAKAGRKSRHLSVAEVYDKLDEMIDTRLSRYEGVTDLTIAGVAL